MDNTIEKILLNSKSIVFMTGAGISTASGIPDFRSNDGIYNKKYKYNAEYMLSRSFFDLNPEEFYDFYINTMVYPNARPNDAHKAIAKLEEMGKDVKVITQNIDGLHQQAGSKYVYELHGSVKRNYCMKCHKLFDEHYVTATNNVPRCDSCDGIVKPDVVLYEEPLDYEVQIESINAIKASEVLVVVGTSLQVNPAASLVRFFHGKYFIIINLSTTPYDRYANYLVREKAENALQFLLKN